MVADVLSRRCHELIAMTTSIDLREYILQHLYEDRFYSEVFHFVQAQRPLEGKFLDYTIETDGILHHRGCIYVPSFGGFHDFIILEAHIEPYAGHPGVKKLHEDLR